MKKDSELSKMFRREPALAHRPWHDSCRTEHSAVHDSIRLYLVRCPRSVKCADS